MLLSKENNKRQRVIRGQTGALSENARLVCSKSVNEIIILLNKSTLKNETDFHRVLDE